MDFFISYFVFQGNSQSPTLTYNIHSIYLLNEIIIILIVGAQKIFIRSNNTTANLLAGPMLELFFQQLCNSRQVHDFVTQYCSKIHVRLKHTKRCKSQFLFPRNPRFISTSQILQPYSSAASSYPSMSCKRVSLANNQSDCFTLEFNLYQLAQ